MRFCSVVLAIGMALIPVLSNASERAEVSWWAGEGAAFTVNGKTAGYSEWWGIVQTESQACAINFSSMFGQESAILFQGVSAGGVMKLSFATAIRGSYNPGYGPIDPRFFIEALRPWSKH